MTRPTVTPRGEQALVGPGAGGGTVRVGNTVRRPPHRAPDAMIEVLRHLEAVGFDGAPRVLGRDEAGRWVLTYIPGDAPMPPYAAWVAATHPLASVATLLRRYHDAVAGYRPPPDLQWPTVPPRQHVGSLVGHLDVSMANVVFRQGRAVALIDFEEVGLVTCVWDVARTVRHWVPLIDPVDLPVELRPLGGRHVQRLGLFADSYRLDDAKRRQLVDTVLLNADASYERMRRGAATGHVGYTREWTGHAATRNRRGRDWVEAHRGELERALGGS